jgi:hypothetical protein
VESEVFKSILMLVLLSGGALSLAWLIGRWVRRKSPTVGGATRKNEAKEATNNCAARRTS